MRLCASWSACDCDSFADHEAGHEFDNSPGDGVYSPGPQRFCKNSFAVPAIAGFSVELGQVRL